MWKWFVYFNASAETCILRAKEDFVILPSGTTAVTLEVPEGLSDQSMNIAVDFDGVIHRYSKG